MGGIYIKNKWLPYLLILPTVVLICIFKIYPIIDSVIQGFLGAEGGFTFNNYKVLFADKTFWDSLIVTIKFNVIIIPLQIVIAFIMAMLVNVKVKGIEIFRTIFYLQWCDEQLAGNIRDTENRLFDRRKMGFAFDYTDCFMEGLCLLDDVLFSRT